MEFCQGYGATETTSLVTSTFRGTKEVDYSSCGFGMSNTEMMFVDPVTAQPVPIGEVSNYGFFTSDNQERVFYNSVIITIVNPMH